MLAEFFNETTLWIRAFRQAVWQVVTPGSVENEANIKFMWNLTATVVQKTTVGQMATTTFFTCSLKHV